MDPTQKPSINMMLLALVIILIIIAVVFGGNILFLKNKETTSPKITPQILPSESVKATTTITPTSAIVITDDPKNIDVGSVEEDIRNIGVDVQSLQ